jgi:endonuclease/exonuclease/phosphatase (EEP) superfamily protein YafD
VLPKSESPGRILCLLGMCVAFAGIGTGHLSQYFIVFDVFSHFTLHFAIAAIALGWAFLMPKHRLMSAVAMMLVGMLAIGLWPNVEERVLPPRDAVEAPEGYRELRVMSFNAWLMNREPDAIKAQIELQDPDVVFIAEVSRLTLNMARSLKQEYPYQYPSLVPRGFRLWIMSRYPLREVVARGPWRGPVFLRASLGPQWGNLTLVGTHTIRPPAVNAQWKQINALATYVSTIPQPRLVMGDFNATPYSRMTRQFAEVTGLTRRSQLPTWPANSWRLPQIAIDHMFADDSLLFPQGVQVGQTAGSDHLPIMARILVPVPERSAGMQLKETDQ